MKNLAHVLCLCLSVFLVSACGGGAETTSPGISNGSLAIAATGDTKEVILPKPDVVLQGVASVDAKPTVRIGQVDVVLASFRRTNNGAAPVKKISWSVNVNQPGMMTPDLSTLLLEKSVVLRDDQGATVPTSDYWVFIERGRLTINFPNGWYGQMPQAVPEPKVYSLVAIVSPDAPVPATVTFSLFSAEYGGGGTGEILAGETTSTFIEWRQLPQVQSFTSQWQQQQPGVFMDVAQLLVSCPWGQPDSCHLSKVDMTKIGGTGLVLGDGYHMYSFIENMDALTFLTDFTVAPGSTAMLRVLTQANQFSVVTEVTGLRVSMGGVTVVPSVPFYDVSQCYSVVAPFVKKYCSNVSFGGAKG